MYSHAITSSSRSESPSNLSTEWRHAGILTDLTIISKDDKHFDVHSCLVASWSEYVRHLLIKPCARTARSVSSGLTSINVDLTSEVSLNLSVFICAMTYLVS